MQHIKISRGNKRLLLFFNGWAMDGRPAQEINIPGYDTMVVWDYVTMDFDPQWIEGYQEICLVAWSYGVYAATLSLAQYSHLVTRRLAFSGTPFPIDANYGIHPRIVDAILKQLQKPGAESILEALHDGSDTEDKGVFECRRPIEEVTHELRCFRENAKDVVAPEFKWDYAIFGTKDTVFPPKRQKAYWESIGAKYLEVEGGTHCLKMLELIPQYIIDKDLVGERFRTAINTYAPNATVQRQIAQALNETISQIIEPSDIKDKIHNILEIGCGTGLLTELYTPHFKDAQILLTDLNDMGVELSEHMAFRQCDAELLLRELPKDSFDLVVSSSTIQWFNSQLQALKNIIRILRPGGRAVVSTFSSENLAQIHSFLPNPLPSYTLEEFERLIPQIKGVVEWECCQIEITLEFDSAHQLMKHLQLTGVNGLSRQGSQSARKILSSLEPNAEGKYPLTYKPIIISLVKSEEAEGQTPGNNQ